MQLKKTGLNALLALGIAFSQSFALAETQVSVPIGANEASLAFDRTFHTVASYLTESGDGLLSVEVPEEIAQTLDQEVFTALLASIELHNAQLASSEQTDAQDSLRIPFAKKLIIIGLKHGGPVVKKIVSKVSPKAGKWIGKYADKLAKFLEDLENWAELPIITYLVKNGVPPADAKIMAEIIVALL
jgi:hypothetical protein